MSIEVKDNISYYYQTEEELTRVKEAIAKKADNRFLENKLVELKTTMQKDVRILQRINDELGKKDLVFLFKWYWESYEETIFGMAIDIYFDDVLCRQLLDYLVLKVKDKERRSECFALFTSPMKLTTTQKEELEFLGILLRTKADRTKLFKEHLGRYAYIPMWCDNDPWSLEDLHERSLLYPSPKIVEERLHLLKGEVKRRKKKQQQITTELKPGKEILELIAIIQEFSFLRQEGEVQMGYHNFQGYQLKEKICAQLKITKRGLKFLTDDEILDHLRRKKSIPLGIIRKRQKYCFVVFRDGVGHIMTGRRGMKEAKKIRDQIYYSINAKGHTWQGTVGSPGEVTGRACIIHNLSDIAKIRSGEIMVVSGTSVEYITAMEKAGGIITEFGGITSHAAVIARELQKPCVIQIDNATNIFRDGDILEVDAKKGVITRLS